MIWGKLVFHKKPLFALVLFWTLLAAVLAFLINRFEIRLRSLQAAILLSVCLAPQMLHLAAWDTARIWTYSIICSFLSLWVYVKVLPPADHGSSVVNQLSLAALIVNIIILTPLMDGEQDHFNLMTRFLLYLPVLAACLALFLYEEFKMIKKETIRQHQ